MKDRNYPIPYADEHEEKISDMVLYRQRQCGGGDLGLAYLYEMGFLVPQDLKIAARLYREKYEHCENLYSFEEYFRELGYPYQKRSKIYNEENGMFIRCKKWYPEVGEKLYEPKIKTPEDIAQLERKAEVEDDSSIAVDLACKYISGNFVPRDEKKAIYWLHKAARYKDEHFYAMVALGKCYEYGIIVKQDLSKAIRLYKRYLEWELYGPNEYIEELYRRHCQKLGIEYRDIYDGISEDITYDIE